MSKEKNTKASVSPYDIDGRPPLTEAVPLALQHVLAMFAGNVTVPIIIAGAIGMTMEERTFLIQCAMLLAGLATLLQVYRIGPMGSKLPVVMGTSFGFVPTSIAIGTQFGFAGIMGASLIGGLFEGVLGFFIKPLRKYFPPIVTGTVLLSIGLSLLPTGINYVAGGVGAADFGSFTNLFLAAVVLITIVVCNQFTKGFSKISAILIGIVVGYIVAIPLGKVNFSGVASAGWFSFPTPLKYGMTFHWQAILTTLIMYVVTAVETVGDISGITVGGAGREATDEELSGGVIADGIASAFAALFNALPNTSFSQNVGIITLTKVMSTFTIKIGALFLIFAALIPKFGAVIAAMPTSVLGGAGIVMFGNIAIMGIKLITKDGLNNRQILILSIALSIGFGFGSVPAALAAFPQTIQLLFGGSGIAISCLIALILNIILPEEKEVETNITKGLEQEI